MILTVLVVIIAGLSIALERERKLRRREREVTIASQRVVANLLEAIHSGAEFFACPACGRVSYSPEDISKQECKNCRGVIPVKQRVA